MLAFVSPCLAIAAATLRCGGPQLPRRKRVARRANGARPLVHAAIGASQHVIQPTALAAIGREKAESTPPGGDARMALLLLAIHLISGAMFVALLEGWSFVEAIYFAVAVGTTIGYGDLAPTRSSTRLFVALYALLSTGLIGKLLARVVDAAATAAATPRNGADGDMLEDARMAENIAGARVRRTALLLLVACGTGALLYGCILQQLSIVDILYFITVTVTTVGLGDIHPNTVVGRAFAAVWLAVASLGFANLFARFAEYRGLCAQRKAVEAENLLRGKILSAEVFAAMDEDGDGRLNEGEFLGYVVCKLGKVTPEEVRGIRARFCQLDKDGSGFITKNEVLVSHKSPKDTVRNKV